MRPRDSGGHACIDRRADGFGQDAGAAALEAGGASQRPDLDPIVVSIEAKLRRPASFGIRRWRL
jgi:hypothetical protein